MNTSLQVCETERLIHRDELDFQLETVMCGLCGSSEYQVVLPRIKELSYDLNAYFDVVKCNSCGFVSTTPRPAVENRGCFCPDSARYYHEQ